jgi:hypothetical protein
MTCSEVKDLLSPYLDGELDSVSRQAVFRHLSLCAHCHNELAEMKQLVKLLACLEEIDPPEDFSAKLSCRLSESVATRQKIQGRNRFSLHSWLPFGAAAAIIMALAFSLNLWPVEQRTADVPMVAVSPQLVPDEKPLAPLPAENMVSLKTAAEGSDLAGQQVKAPAEMFIAPAPSPAPPVAPGDQTLQKISPMQIRSVPSLEIVSSGAEPAARNGRSAGEKDAAAEIFESPLVEKWIVSLADIGEGYLRLTSFSKSINWNIAALAESSGTIVLSAEGQMEGLDSLLSFVKELGKLEHRENLLPQLLQEQKNTIRRVNEEINMLLDLKSQADNQGKAEIEAQISQKRNELAALMRRDLSMQIKTSLVRVEVHFIAR